MKNRKKCRIVDFDSSKEGFWCTDCNAKNLSSLQSTVHEKIKKNRPKWSTNFKMVKNYHCCQAFLVFFFRNGTFQRAGVFCVAFSASIPLFWAIKINNPTIFLIFHPKGGPYWFWGGKILPTWLKIVEILKLKQFWNQCDKWSNLAACILVSCDQGGYKNHPNGGSVINGAYPV